ncbi:MAG: diguanylate cyclase [Lachnospiraceae bacterium]|nr:diguanylate cyclase [Lachnospiraceae bacterium]
MQQINIDIYLMLTKEIIENFIPDAAPDGDIGASFYNACNYFDSKELLPVGEIKAKELPGDAGIIEKKEDENKPEPTIKDSIGNVIICDDIFLLKQCVDTFEKIKIIYVGDSSVAESGMIADVCLDDINFDRLYDIWSPNVSVKAGDFRVKKLLINLKKLYDAWLYKNYLETTINSIPELIWYKDMRGAHEKVNDKFCEIVHKTKEQVEGRGHYYIWDISVEEYETGEYICMESEEEVMTKKETCIFEEPVKTSEGMKLFVTYKSPIFDLDGEVFGTVGIAHDMTNFTDVDTRLSILIENLPYPLMICDQNFKAIRFNSSFKKYFGFTDKDVNNFGYKDWKDRTFIPESDALITEKGVSTNQNMIFRKYGNNYYFKLIERQIIDYFGNLSGYYCIFRNQTKERNYSEKILKMANRDYLTKLSNRRQFYDYLDEHRKEAFTIVYMDLNNFKYINDKFGHSEGDEVLKKSAQVLENTFKDALIARIGGDEFAGVLLGIQSDEELNPQIEKLKKDIHDICPDESINFGISVGITKSDEGDTDVELMIQKSDNRMYADKKEQKKRLE